MSIRLNATIGPFIRGKIDANFPDSTHALIFGGKIIACPAADWQATGGEKLFTNTTRFRFLVYFALFFFSLNYNELAVKGKKKHLVHRGKDFLLLCKGKATADLLDKCLTSAGVSRPFKL